VDATAISANAGSQTAPPDPIAQLANTAANRAAQQTTAAKMNQNIAEQAMNLRGKVLQRG
jgi:hypothetical protein